MQSALPIDTSGHIPSGRVDCTSDLGSQAEADRPSSVQAAMMSAAAAEHNREEDDAMAETDGTAVPKLAVPLTHAQVEAANQLYQRYLVGWQRYDRVLYALREHFPSNKDLECVLPKAVTLNQLYATNVLAITRMAGHIVDVLGQEPNPPDPCVVEKIAWLQDAGKNGMHFRSFASKYCHFFISADRFPILDDLAGHALDYHLGRRRRAHVLEGPFSYLTYVADINRLRETAGLDCSYVETDRYLWLCGQWLRLRNGKRAGKSVLINGEVRGLLEAPDARAAELLRVAFLG